jgi:hypothetical protein
MLVMGERYVQLDADWARQDAPPLDRLSIDLDEGVKARGEPALRSPATGRTVPWPRGRPAW